MKHFEPGQEIAGLRIERELGAGAYGRVYLAVDQMLQREVALKLVPAPINAKRREAALREARMVGGIKSPHVVTLHRAVDLGAVDLEHGGAWLLEMEYVAGGTLADLLAEQETVPVTRSWIGARTIPARASRNELPEFLISGTWTSRVRSICSSSWRPSTPAAQ